MKKYQLLISPEAQNDIYQLNHYISHTYNAPYTAEKYLIGLYDCISSLTNYASSIRVSDKKDILYFGLSARAIFYKKRIAIIYTIHSCQVVVRRIIPASLIIE